MMRIKQLQHPLKIGKIFANPIIAWGLGLTFAITLHLGAAALYWNHLSSEDANISKTKIRPPILLLAVPRKNNPLQSSKKSHDAKTKHNLKSNIDTPKTKNISDIDSKNAHNSIKLNNFSKTEEPKKERNNVASSQKMPLPLMRPQHTSSQHHSRKTSTKRLSRYKATKKKTEPKSQRKTTKKRQSKQSPKKSSAQKRIHSTRSNKKTNHKTHKQSVSNAARKASKRARISYGRQLKRWIERNKHYPEFARKQRIEGTGRVKLTINRQGRITRLVLVKKTGNSALDRETIQILRRMAPFPAIPHQIKGKTLTIAISIEFALNE